MILAAKKANEEVVSVTAAREPVSAFVITYNEEEQIAECLRSLSFCDEIVVVDSFSQDRTVEIATEFGAKVIQRPWPGYRAQKAFGLSQVTHEWVLNVDADERISDGLRENIINVLKDRHAERVKREKLGLPLTAPEDKVGYYMNRVVFYLGRWWRLGGWYPEYRLRLFLKSRCRWGGVDPHEKPIVDGPTAYVDGELQHYTYKNFDEQLERLHSLSTLSAIEEYEAGKRASFLSIAVNPLLRMFKFYILKKGYREGIAGFIVAAAEGYYTFMKYAKLWEHEFNDREGKK